MPYAAKQQQFLQRKFNLLKKTDQLAKLYNADLAVIICRNDRYYIYWLINKELWLSFLKEIVYFKLYY